MGVRSNGWIDTRSLTASRFGPRPGAREGKEVSLQFTASCAAIELDNIRIERGSKTDSIKSLVDLVGKAFPPEGQRDNPIDLLSSMGLVLSRVFPKDTIQEVAAATDAFLKSLRLITHNAELVRELKPTMIDDALAVCLSVSRHAAPKRRVSRR